MAVQLTPGMTREAVERLAALKNEPAWLLERRLRAWEIFQALPMPTRQDEEWRRTDISKLRLDDLVPYAEPTASPVETPLRLTGAAGGTLTHQNSVTVD